MKKEVKITYRLIIFITICVLIVLHSASLWQATQNVFIAMMPIWIGIIVAFVLNVPMKRLERLYTRWNVPTKWIRLLALTTVLVLFAMLIMMMISVVIPLLLQFVTNIMEWLFFAKAIAALTKFISANSFIDAIKNIDYASISASLSNLLMGFTKSLGVTVTNLFSLAMSVFLTCSLLMSKDHLASMTKRLLNVLLPKRTANYLIHVGHVTVDTYDKFLVGQVIEAFIIGGLIWGTYQLLGFPYAAMIGVLTGVLSFLPYVGPFLACTLGALFILTQDPIQAIASIIIFQIVQLIEGNIIYPRVVGKSVGLPPVLTLLSALIGASVFGFIGMIFFIPFVAVIYRLVREYVEQKETNPN